MKNNKITVGKLRAAAKVASMLWTADSPQAEKVYRALKNAMKDGVSPRQKLDFENTVCFDNGYNWTCIAQHVADTDTQNAA